MTRTATIVTFAVLVSILTPAIASAAGATDKAPAMDREAKVETTGSITSAPAEEPACGRRIKVVYAGYGEAKNTPCTAAADVRR